ncbi:MAG: hypothetical protein ACHQAX_00425 [Gammaproteobacteria bacterium]
MIKEFKSWFAFNPPDSATLEDWEKFGIQFKAEAPIRYYLNRIVDLFEYRVINKIKDAKWWIRHRTTEKYHLVDTGLSPGYYDADTRMLHSVFSILKDFVEIECASMYRIFYPWRSKVMDNKRCGVEYMKAMGKANEKENPKYLRATQVLLESYDYWTVQRPILVQELDAFLEARPTPDDNSAKEYFKKEKSLDRQDTLYLQKIAKHRQFMWT